MGMEICPNWHNRSEEETTEPQLNNKMLEVCIDSLESAINAVKGGADELEACSSLNDGGLTPSPGLVNEVLQLVKSQPQNRRTKINVMLRCRGGDDFLYSDQEITTMLADIDIYKEMGVDRFVFGALTGTQQIDGPKCKRIVARASPLPVTFHRAFDLCSDPKFAIETIINLGFDRLLSSGQKKSVDDVHAVHLIKSLVATYGSKIEIMPGSGLNSSNAQIFIDIGCKIVHSSCKRTRNLPKMERKLPMGITDSSYVSITDESVVRKLKEALKGLSQSENVKREADSCTNL